MPRFTFTSILLLLANTVFAQNSDAKQEGVASQLEKVDSSIHQVVDKTLTPEGLVLSSRMGKYGYTNLKKEVIIPFKYDWGAGEFSQGLAFVRKGWLIGYIDTKGNEVIPFKFSNGTNFSEELAAVAQNEKWGYIDPKGEIVIPCEYDLAFEFCLGRALVVKNGKHGFINRKGELVIPLIYESGGSFSRKLKIAIVKKNGVYIKIDVDGNEVK